MSAIPTTGTYIAIAAGEIHGLALKSDGTLVSWGDGKTDTGGDAYGNISGTPTTGTYVAIAAGNNYNMAIKSDGTIVGWGYDGYHIITDIPAGSFTMLTARTKHCLALTGIPLLGTALSVDNIAADLLSPSVTLKATLKTKLDGTPLANQEVAFKLGKSALGTVTTDSVGIATMVYANPANLGVGAKAITITYAGDVGFKATQGIGTLTVSKVSTLLTPSNATGYIGQTINITAKLRRKADLVPLNGQTITFKSGGVALGSATTNSAGIATLSYTISNSAPAGIQTLSIVFAGDATYAASTKAATLTVTKIPTSIKTTAFSGSPGATKSLTGILTRKSDGAALASQTLAYKIDGNLIGAAVTDATGKAALSYKFDETYAVGAHTLTVEYAGDATNAPSARSGALTVAKAATKLAPTTVSGKVGVTVTLKATLTRTTDKAPLAGRVVKFQVEGVDVGAGATDASGVATLNYTIPSTLSVGLHITTIIFDGDSLYLNTSNSSGILKVK